MEAKQFLGLGILGVGAYVLYEYFYGAANAPVPITNGTVGVTPGTSTAINNQATASIRTVLLQAAGATDSTLMNADQWGYYANSLLSGGPLTSDKFGQLFTIPYGGDRSKLYTVDQYLSVLHGAGLAGLPNLRRMTLPSNPQMARFSGATAMESANRRFI